MLESTDLELTTSDAATPLATAAVPPLAALADPLRWSLVRYLDARGENCACDLGEAFGVAQNLLSYHLKILREAGLVTCERRGRWAHYRLADDAVHVIARALPFAGPDGEARRG